MIEAHLRRDAVVKMVCLGALALHGLAYGVDFAYFRTFFFGPAFAAILGGIFGFYTNHNHAEVERDAQRFAPDLLARMLAPLSLVSLGGTLLVIAHNVSTGSYVRLGWWPIALGTLLGNNVGELLQISKSRK